MGSLSALTILAGLADAIPPGQNAPLAKSLGLPVTAALLTLLVSTAGLPVGGLALGKLSMPTGPQLGQVPGWAWLGGFLRVPLILAQLDASPAIGAATFLWIIVTVGVLTLLVLDHFGWIGFRLHRASVWRVAGAVLMVIGVGGCFLKAYFRPIALYLLLIPC